MLKRISVILLITTSIISAQGSISSAQLLEGLRVVGGLNYSTWASAGFDDDEDIGYTAGVRIGVEKILPSGMIAGISFAPRGYTSSWKSEDNSYSSESEIIAKYLTGTIMKPYPMGGVEGQALLLGADIGYFWNGKAKWKWTEDGDSETDTESISRDEWIDAEYSGFDVGIVAGFQYPISPQISIVGSYYFGLMNIFPDADDSITNRSFGVYLTYKL